jgi:hypothetical protein
MVTLLFPAPGKVTVAEPQPLRMGEAGAGPDKVPPEPKTAGVASLLPVNPAPGKPQAAASWAAESPLGARQLGELFYVTMILPIRQGTTCPRIETATSIQPFGTAVWAEGHAGAQSMVGPQINRGYNNILFLFPKLPLGNPLQAKLLLCERIIHYCTMRPKQELGNEGKAGCASLSRPQATGFWLCPALGVPPRRPCASRPEWHIMSQPLSLRNPAT